MAIKERQTHIERKEAEYRRKYGQDVTLHNKGTKTKCTTCRYDPIYKKSQDPNCPTCGGTGWITQDLLYTIRGAIRFFSSLELKQLEAGNVKIGDCEIRMYIDNKAHVEQAISEKNVCGIDGVTFAVTMCNENTLRSEIVVLCNRIA